MYRIDQIEIEAKSSPARMKCDIGILEFQPIPRIHHNLMPQAEVLRPECHQRRFDWCLIHPQGVLKCKLAGELEKNWPSIAGHNPDPFVAYLEVLVRLSARDRVQ